MITHRCKESLKAEVSIRYTFKFEDEGLRYFTNDKEAWRLFKYDKFEEENMHISEIKYCPFCNKDLNEDKHSSFKAIQDISSKYFKTIEDEELAEERLSKITNYKINKNSRMTEEEYNKFINDNIEDIVELETNTECDTFEEQWLGGVR